MKITETRSFTLTHKLKDAVRVTFLNRLGGTDCAMFTKYYSSEVKTKNQSFTANNAQRTHLVEIDKTITYYSQHLTEPEFGWLQDLMVSPAVTVNGKPVRVVDSTYKFDSIERLWQVELMVQSIYAENKITL